MIILGLLKIIKWWIKILKTLILVKLISIYNGKNILSICNNFLNVKKKLIDRLFKLVRKINDIVVFVAIWFKMKTWSTSNIINFFISSDFNLTLSNL